LFEIMWVIFILLINNLVLSFPNENENKTADINEMTFNSNNSIKHDGGSSRN